VVHASRSRFLRAPSHPRSRRQLCSPWSRAVCVRFRRLSAARRTFSHFLNSRLSKKIGALARPCAPTARASARVLPCKALWLSPGASKARCAQSTALKVTRDLDKVSPRRTPCVSSRGDRRSQGPSARASWCTWPFSAAGQAGQPCPEAHTAAVDVSAPGRVANVTNERGVHSSLGPRAFVPLPDALQRRRPSSPRSQWRYLGSAHSVDGPLASTEDVGTGAAWRRRVSFRSPTPGSRRARCRSLPFCQPIPSGEARDGSSRRAATRATRSCTGSLRPRGPRPAA